MSLISNFWSTISYQFLVRIELRVVVSYSIFFTYFRKSQFSENNVFTDTRITEVPHHYTLIFLPISSSEEESITLASSWQTGHTGPTTQIHQITELPPFIFTPKYFSPWCCKYKLLSVLSLLKKILILLNTTYISIPVFQSSHCKKYSDLCCICGHAYLC